MTSAAESNEASSAPNDTIRRSRQDLKRGLVRESFHRILDIFQQLSLYEKLPKLFVIYAHDNEKSGLKAYQETVKEYISWFKRIRFNVDPDRSPHGYGPAHDVGHSGASNDIFKNQVCLLPKSWHKQNVDYVLVFYSKILASYMKDERNFKLMDKMDNENKTYSCAIIDTCKSLQVNSKNEWDGACRQIRDIQESYSKGMGASFHHVMTETALLSFTNRHGALDKTIPIILFGDEDWEPDLKWQPRFVNNKDTQIRITIRPEEEYRQFFKILLEFEPLERDRPLIDIMIKCFEDSVKLLEDELQPEAYRKQLEVLILAALRKLNHQWQRIERPITRGDLRSRLDLYSKLDCESIRRISGEWLLGSLKDIDLAVTRRLNAGGDEESEKGHRADRQIAPLHDLSEEGKQQERQIVPLHGLFDERNVGGKNVRPHRILIQGRPGIGKTTLCRRLMYEYSWHENLRMEFDLVVRIPLRKLKYSADLKNLLFEEYFQAVSEGLKLSNKLADLILDNGDANSENNNTSSAKILIILDGLDEARGWSEERGALLKKLMQRPTVIITSRSYDTDMLHVSVDLRLEALGLSMMSVQAYLDNTEIVPSDTATEIHRFIETKPFIKDMVRVPIHLDILCYSWDELHGRNTLINKATDEADNVTPRITPLYQAVVRSLWRKDIPVLGKLDHGEPVNVEVINAVRSSARLERLTRIKSSFLGEIAIEMMKSNRLEFTDEDIAEAIQRLELNGNQLPLSLERNLHKLSVLHSYPSEHHRKYSFAHPTIQEFFAAQYLAHHLTHNRASFENLLRRHRYDRRYELVWMFFTGILSKVEELDFFFNLLEDEPRDLVGLQHIHLFMYCLSECQLQIRPSRWDEYQERLGEWLEVDLVLDIYSHVGSSMAFPEKILREHGLLLANFFEELRVALMRTIIRRNWISKSLIEFANQLIEATHKKKFLKSVMPSKLGRLSSNILETLDFSTLWILEQGANLPAQTISKFMVQIKEGKALGLEAILMSQRQLPDFAIKELTEWLQDKDNRLSMKLKDQLSMKADQILGNQENLPKETIDSAIERLSDQGLKNFFFPTDPDKGSMLSRQDLHPEAIGKVCDYLENADSRGDEIPDRLLLGVSRMYFLRLDDAERLGNILERRLRHKYTESSKLVDDALGQQASLVTNVLMIFLKLLGDEHGDIFEAAQHILRKLRKQPALGDDIIEKLRALFENDKGKVVAVLKERLQLPDQALNWLQTQITEENDTDIKCQMAIDYLFGKTDLPKYLENSLPELTNKGVDFKLVGKLLCQLNKPSNEVISRFLELIAFQTLLDRKSDELMPIFMYHAAFASPLIKMLEQTTNDKVAENIHAILARHGNLHQDSVQHLKSLLINQSKTGMKNLRIIFDCLLSQVNLDGRTIPVLHDTIRKKETRDRLISDIGNLWMSQHVELLYANLASFNSITIYYNLRGFLERSVEDLAPAYIHGNTLYFYTADGNLTEETLEDATTFRKRFREAQTMVRLPNWALIKEPHGMEEQDLSSAS